MNFFSCVFGVWALLSRKTLKGTRGTVTLTRGTVTLTRGDSDPNSKELGSLSPLLIPSVIPGRCCIWSVSIGI